MSDSVCSNLEEWDESLPDSPVHDFQPNTRHKSIPVVHNVINEAYEDDDDFKDVKSTKVPSIHNMYIDRDDTLKNGGIQDITMESLLKQAQEMSDNDDSDEITVDINELEKPTVELPRAPKQKKEKKKRKMNFTLFKRKKLAHVTTNVNDDDDVSVKDWKKATMEKLNNLIQTVYLNLFEIVHDIAEQKYNGEINILTFNESDINTVQDDNLTNLDAKDIFYGFINIQDATGKVHKFEIISLSELFNNIIANLKGLQKHISIKHTKNHGYHIYALYKGSPKRKRQYYSEPQHFQPVQPSRQLYFPGEYIQVQPAPQYHLVQRYPPGTYWYRRETSRRYEK